MHPSREEVAGTIAPLRFIFWGGLLCVLDLTITTKVNGGGFRFDVLNDLVGMLLITHGVFRLAAVQVHDRYSSAMGFVRIVAVLSTLKALQDHFIYREPEALSVLFALLSLAELIAIVVFCVAMRWLSSEARLTYAAESWTTTIWLVTLIYLIPLGFFYAAGVVALLTGTSFKIDLGPGGLLLLPVFCAPLIHLFMSTSRMRNEAETAATTPFDDSQEQAGMLTR